MRTLLWSPEKGEWERWYAWRPVLIGWQSRAPLYKVWLEWVERRKPDSRYDEWEYRFPDVKE